MIYGIYGLEGLLLFMAGIEDIRKKEISVIYLAAMGIVALCGCVCRENFNWYGAAGGFLVGLCMIAVSQMSGEQIGRGDGMVVAALGILCGVRNTLGIVCFASIFMLVPVCILLVGKRGNRKTRLPFLPALFLGYLMSLALGGMV